MRRILSPHETPMSLHRATAPATVADALTVLADLSEYDVSTAGTVGVGPLGTVLVRPYKKYDLSWADPQPGHLLGLEQLKAAEARARFRLESGDVAIVQTGWDRYHDGGPDGLDPLWWARNQPGLSGEACGYLADMGIAALASDTATAGGLALIDGEVVAGQEQGRRLLARGVLAISGLRCLAAAPATGAIVALPVATPEATRTPMRAVLLGA